MALMTEEYEIESEFGSAVGLMPVQDHIRKRRRSRRNTASFPPMIAGMTDHRCRIDHGTGHDQCHNEHRTGPDLCHNEQATGHDHYHVEHETGARY